MTDLFSSLRQWELFTPERLLSLVQAVLIFGVGLILARVLSRMVWRLVRDRVTAQEGMLVRRFVFYLLFGVVIASALHQMGFKLSLLLGAAGILTVAVGFASQTAASNLISGLFVIAERPFVVGDIVRVADVEGEVLSVDLLSVKVRTYDNLYVRIPNEEILKSRITTVTRFPIRRLDLRMGVAYKEDLDRVRQVLLEVAERNPLCLKEPEPLWIFQRYGDSALEFQFSVWTQRTNFLQLRNSIQIEIKNAFDAAGIEIPFPHRSLYVGSVTEPFPVRLETAREGSPPPPSEAE